MQVEVFDSTSTCGPSTSRKSRSTDRGSEDPAGTTNTRLVVTLLAVSFSFLVTTLPRSAALIVAAFVQHLVRPSVEAWTPAATVTACRVRLALAATELLMYANHAVNFFLYCAAGERFRRQLCLLCRYRGGVDGDRSRAAVELTLVDRKTRQSVRQRV